MKYLLFSFYLLFFQDDPIVKTSNPIDGAKLYKINCKLCHGKKGTRTFSGAKDISKSKLSVDDRIKIITEGRGSMASFGDNLTPEEIKAIAIYTLTFSNPE